ATTWSAGSPARARRCSPSRPQAEHVGIHPAFADRFHLLDGIPSIEAAMADPELDRRMREYMEPPRGPVPDVATRDLTVDGPHAPVPIRVYEPATGGADRPA